MPARELEVLKTVEEMERLIARDKLETAAFVYAPAIAEIIADGQIAGDKLEGASLLARIHAEAIANLKRS